MFRGLNPPPPPPANPFAVLMVLPQVCELLAAWLDWLNEVVDSVAQTYDAKSREQPELRLLFQQSLGTSRRPKAKGPPLAKFARSATLKWGPVSAQLFVDGQTVRLSQTLGMLAELLLDDASFPSAQSGSGWKSRKDLRQRLAKRTGREMKKGAFENLIYRLKKALRTQAGLDWLVDNGGPLGVRFALLNYIPGTAPASGDGGKSETEQGKHDTDYGEYSGEI
jgi:hypothetical protein